MALCCVSIASAQSGFSIKSFTELTQDLDARVSYPELDQNGHKCALVKVYTTESNFSFDNGLLGVTKVIHKPELSEWWVYLPAKTMKLKIMHPVLGQLKDSDDGFYYFPAPLKEAACYRMELTTGKVIVTVEEERKQTGWLIISSQPDGADVYLTEDGVENYAGQTPFQKKLTYGSYNYRLKKPLYHDEVGVAVVDNTKVEPKIVLRPAFGSLRVTSTPVDAKVTLQNDSRTFTTPCTIEQIPSGTYKVNVVAPRYASFVQNVVIEDGKQALLDATLDARFAEVTINTLPGATITINGQVKGKGSCREELVEGIYDIEVSLANHRSVTRQIEVVAKQSQNLIIEPIPIYGSLDVITEPIFANVTINGKSYGDTPLSIEKMLIGDYEVVLCKAGYASVTKRVSITEGTQSTIEATLPQGREMTIRSDASGDEVFVDGTRVGVTPLTTNLAFGNHTIELHRAGKTTRADVNITTSGKEKEIVLSFGLMPRWSANITASQKAVLQKLIDSMVSVEGGTFTMGATSEQGSDVYSDEKPAHQVTLSDYMICKTEVTQEIWQAVMGSNPSKFKGSDLPVEEVSYKDCQEFIKKLNSLTGLQFRLPTEAEWEYAARGGSKSQGYKYSGSNDIGSVAWYYENSGNSRLNDNNWELDKLESNNCRTHAVATKSPNELGLYDMSGNVHEWCSDWYGDNSSGSQTNPKGPSSGSYHVIRGGRWGGSARNCRVSCRIPRNPDDGDCYLGLRLAHGEESQQQEIQTEPKFEYKTYTVNGVSFDMVSVAGGTFTMGATSEQGGDAESDEMPAHQVTLSDYMIGKTEVTQELWQAVMGSNPSEFSGYDLPVESVSWNDCQKFIKKLNKLTGLQFRLPTEAEWEYAAQGGNKSKGYKYSGSNDINSVAWYDSNSSSRIHAVATKIPNELGLYDMSGNVWEWCSDWYDAYNSGSQTNPKGASSGSRRVVRGGSWSSCASYSMVSYRYNYYPYYGINLLGLRLAL